jgi:hypothetical protein
MTGVTSKDRTTLSSPAFIYSTALGNVSVDTIRSEDLYGFSSVLNMNNVIASYAYCTTSVHVDRYFDMKNMYISLRNPNKDLNRFNTFIVGTIGNDYVINYMNFTNIYVHDVYYSAMLPFGTIGSINDYVYVDDVIFDNVNANDYGYLFMNTKVAVISNFTYQNSFGMSFPLVMFNDARNLTINNLTVKNFTGVTSAINSLFFFLNRPTAGVTFDGFRIEDSQMVGSQLINLISETYHITLKNLVIVNSGISSGKDLIYFSKIRSVDISDWIINKFVNSDEENDISTVLSISSIDLSGDYQDELYEVRRLVTYLF